MIKIKQLQIFNQHTKIVDIGFDIRQKTALVGMSGSGKSLTLKAILNLLPANLSLKMDIESHIQFIFYYLIEYQ